jgi:hypothetical protein
VKLSYFRKKKLYGKTASCMDEREIEEIARISYFFSFILTYIFVRGKKTAYFRNDCLAKKKAHNNSGNCCKLCQTWP